MYNRLGVGGVASLRTWTRLFPCPNVHSPALRTPLRLLRLPGRPRPPAALGSAGSLVNKLAPLWCSVNTT